MVGHKGCEEAEAMSYTRQQRFRDTQDGAREPVESERRSELGHEGGRELERVASIPVVSVFGGFPSPGGLCVFHHGSSETPVSSIAPSILLLSHPLLFKSYLKGLC